MTEATELQAAIDEIVSVLHACTQCGRLTCDGTSIAADSAADATDAIDAILRNHNLIPDEQPHADHCV